MASDPILSSRRLPRRPPLPGPKSQPAPTGGAKAATVGACIGCLLLAPANLLVTVYGRHPTPPHFGAWGWEPGAVLLGVGLGGLFGALIGAAAGEVVVAICLVIRRSDRRQARDT